MFTKNSIIRLETVNPIIFDYKRFQTDHFQLIFSENRSKTKRQTAQYCAFLPETTKLAKTSPPSRIANTHSCRTVAIFTVAILITLV